MEIINAPEWVPSWVIDKVRNNWDKILKDTVYSVYECGCFVRNKEDIIRKKRLVQWTENGKRKNKLVCGCDGKSGYVCKVKICSSCEQAFINTKQKEGKCRTCNYQGEHKKIIKLFYQYDTLFEEIPPNPTYTNPDCKYRRDCLHKLRNLPEDKYDVHLWCYNCPKAEDIIDI